MTREEAIEMMKAKLECMTREISGIDQDCNTGNCDECELCYAQGNMGEQKEWLKLAIDALENQKTGHWIITGDYCTGAYGSIDYVKCSCCNEDSLEKGNYCPNCGANMRGE